MKSIFKDISRIPRVPGDGAQDDSDTNIYCDIMPVRTMDAISTVIDDCDIKKTNGEGNHPTQSYEGRFLVLKHVFSPTSSQAGFIFNLALC